MKRRILNLNENTYVSMVVKNIYTDVEKIFYIT